MNDEEITRLCAESVGYSIDDSTCNGGGSGNTGFDILGRAVLDWHNGITFDPLHDRAQAMELVEKLRLSIDTVGESPQWLVFDFDDEIQVINANLLRAICECAAKVQKARKA